MTISKLLKSWSLPDRTEERTQITLRLSYNEYARLHALKDVYKNRSVNDMINDILKAGLDEIVESLPAYKISREEAADIAYHTGEPIENFLNGETGPRHAFESAYRKILEAKSDKEIEEEQQKAGA